MRKNLHAVLDYFGYFSYPPSFHEIYRFFSSKITKQRLRLLLSDEMRKGTIVSISKNRYFRSSQKALDTLPQYGIPTSPRLRGVNAIEAKKPGIVISLYLAILQLCPLIRFVGITGSTAVEGYQKEKDIDLFIITRHRLLWTSRFFAVLFAKLLSIRGQEGVCLNLFFDESDIAIPQKKQNSYIGHELLQMKTVLDKDNFVSRLLSANKWISSYFPNAPKYNKERRILYSKISMFSGIEWFFKLIQLHMIKRNKTGFLITDSQLWLFKNDFEKKLKRKGLVI